MRFALFDHVDRSDRPLARHLDERLEYVAAADAAGFYAYHVAEHHGTPLGSAPSPGLFLAAVAQRTTTLRLGPLAYPLGLGIWLSMTIVPVKSAGAGLKSWNVNLAS